MVPKVYIYLCLASVVCFLLFVEGWKKRSMLGFGWSQTAASGKSLCVGRIQIHVPPVATVIRSIFGLIPTFRKGVRCWLRGSIPFGCLVGAEDCQNQDRGNSGRGKSQLSTFCGGDILKPFKFYRCKWTSFRGSASWSKPSVWHFSEINGRG